MITEITDSKKRILIVEDNKAMSSVLRFNIQKAGYDAVVANNGVEGLEALQREPIDFVITDYQMPEMGGYDFAVNMRQFPTYKTTPLAMCSAKGFELNIDELFEELQIIKLFYKPFSPREIVTFINETLAVTLSGKE